jgi:tetratricopeptide (TPR) repeat protein
MELRHRQPPSRHILKSLLAAAAIAAPLACRVCSAAEDADALIAALRERKMHDLALEYLEARKSSPLVSDAFRARIPYERATTLIDLAQRTPDAARRAELLRQAQEGLSSFASANPESDLAPEAGIRLAQVLLERGRQDVVQAQRLPPGEDAQREELLQSARTTFDQARTQFAEAQEYYNNVRKQFATNLDPRTEADKIERRDEYRLQWLTAWFYKARTQFEKAKAYPQASAEFKELNAQAAAELAELHEKYHTRLVGLTAHLYEGRAYQAVGELDKAIGCFEDIVIQPDGPPEFRLLIAQGWTGLAECLLQQEKLDELLARCEGWLASSSDDDRGRQEWLSVRLLVARAKKLKASRLEEDSPVANKLRREARDEFRLIAREPGPLRREAQQEFASLTSRAGDERAASEVNQFDEAYRLAVEAFEERRALADQAAAADSPDKAAELTDASDESGQKAKAYFQRALAVAPAADELDLAQLNLARYYLAWLTYQDEQFYRAALLGEFLALRYPDSPPARDGAKLAMAAYQQLYQLAREEGASGQALDVEARRMAGIADYVARRWPGTEDAAFAQDMLVSFLIREDRLEEAKAMLDSIEPERRLQAQLRVANGLWAEYLRARRSDGEGGKPSDATVRLGEEAHTRLEASFREAAEANEVSQVVATAGLYLSQSYLLRDDYDAAAKVLEAEKIGPLTLAKASSAAASQPEFLVEVGKSALQAFAFASPPRKEDAAQAMALIEGALKDASDGSARLTQIYLAFGQQLRHRLERLTSAGQSDEAREVAAAMTSVVDRLDPSKAGSDWTTQLWAAHTSFEIGEAISLAGQQDASSSFFEKSLATYDRLLENAAKDPKFAPNERAVMAVRKRKADVLRGMGRFRDAMDIYSELLGENVMMLDVQRDAAYTYQLWGATDARRFEDAIQGGRRVKSTGENRVWGWIKLSTIAAQAARRDPQYRDWYFEARFNAAKARYLSALAVQGDERKDRLFKAKDAIRKLYLSYPELGGTDRYQEFETLVTQIQEALKERPTGLGEFAQQVGADAGNP